LTPRPVAISSTPRACSRASSPVKTHVPSMEKMQIKKLRPKSAVPTINRALKVVISNEKSIA
jgi:hypothetical protein